MHTIRAAGGVGEGVLVDRALGEVHLVGVCTPSRRRPPGPNELWFIHTDRLSSEKLGLRMTGI